MIKQTKIIQKLVDGTISTDERIALKNWILENEENKTWFKNKLKEIEFNTGKTFDTESSYLRLVSQIKQREKSSFTRYYKYAAIVVLMISVSYGVFVNVKDQKVTVVDNVKVPTINETNENSIVITLADGTKKIIDENSKEVIKDKSGNTIANGDGTSLSFTGDSESIALLYNTVTIPYGKTLKLYLSDGTQVWLNAGTEFRFPQNFKAENEYRTVFLKGEAFFDVESDKNKPFIVNSNEIKVEVLGTQFNVSSYENENKLATTLVEGSVTISKKGSAHTSVLKPNYQTVFDKESKNWFTKKVNTKVYTSWMNNVLIIDNYTFSEILKRLERKFDIKIINKSSIENDSDIFKAEFNYNETIEDILHTISLSKPFNYTITNETIIISDR